MTSLSRTLAGLSLALFATVAAAQSTVRVESPYARATVPGQPAGGGYLKVTNTGKEADRLLSVSADVSKSVELHSMSMEGDVMRMRQVDGIDVPAGGSVELKPGGLHIMFIGLKGPLKAGDAFPATLKFAKAGEVKVTMQVNAASSAAAPAHDHGGHKH